jgi:hypothetical protein
VTEASAGASAVRRWPAHAGAAVPLAAALLLASMLYQRPLVEVTGGAGSVLVRPWDIAWILFVAVSVPVLIRQFKSGTAALPTRSSPLAPLLAFGLVSLLSVAWELATFGTDSLASAGIRAVRLAAIGYLAWVLAAVRPAQVRVLVGVACGAAVIAGTMALAAWLLGSEPATGLGVTRPGGPFGNFYASGNADRWWAFPGASAGLGFWLAVAVIVLSTRAIDSASHGRERLGETLACLAGLVPVIGGLVVSHSRESWVAGLLGAVAVLLALRRNLPRWAVRLAPLAGVSVVLIFALAIPSVNTRIVESLTPGTFSFRTGPEARLEAWTDGLRIGIERLPIGWGVGGVEEHRDLFGRATAENVFIQTFVQTGLVGVVLLIATVVSGIRVALRRLAHAPHDIGAVFCLAVISVLVVHGTFGYSLGDPSVQILLGCAIGVLVASTRSGSAGP